jgi:hypothetical protein
MFYIAERSGTVVGPFRCEATGMKYDPEKFAELLLFAAGELESDEAAGAVKLNKVLFFAEFGHMREHGVPISGADYQKLEWGPAPRPLRPVRRALVERGEARLEEHTYRGRTQERLIPVRPARPGALSADEQRSVREAISTLRGLNGTEASDLSHEELGWQMVELHETIPYETAYLRQPVLTEAVTRHAELLADKLGLR